VARKRAPARPGRLRLVPRPWGPGRSAADWTREALCSGQDTDVFFPEDDQPSSIAKSIGRRCPVRGECLAHALETGERYGIWGGMTGHERNLLAARIADRRTAESPVRGPGDDDGPVAA
jgi:WhiB family redox-sensing transcriptional regulator